jgi:hypothetical protein
MYEEVHTYTVILKKNRRGSKAEKGVYSDRFLKFKVET